VSTPSGKHRQEFQIGDVITGKYPIPSQVRSTLLSSSKGTGKTNPYLVIPFPFALSIRKEEYYEAK